MQNQYFCPSCAAWGSFLFLMWGVKSCLQHNGEHCLLILLILLFSTEGHRALLSTTTSPWQSSWSTPKPCCSHQLPSARASTAPYITSRSAHTHTFCTSIITHKRLGVKTSSPLSKRHTQLKERHTSPSVPTSINSPW